MEGNLNLDSILSSEDVENLFANDTQETPPETNGDSEDNTPENKENDTDTTEVNVNTLFTGQPESVGSEENNEGQEEPLNEGSKTSPIFYSSITRALHEEGIFPDLDEDKISKVKTPEDFRNLIEEQIRAGIDEKQRRIDQALSYGVEPNEVKVYEQTLDFLDSIQEDSIKEESAKGEKLRKDLIYQDFINRGYSKERADREVRKSFGAGTDVEDAMEALESNKEFFNKNYEDLINKAKQEEENAKKKLQEEGKKLKSSILEEKTIFGDLSVDKSTRQKIFDNISKPVYKDPETGNYYTAIQKYEKENKADFLKYVSLFYTLTNGFTDINPLIRGKVNKEVKKGIKNLEQTLNTTVRTSDGNLKFVGYTDPDSSARSWSIDV